MAVLNSNVVLIANKYIIVLCPVNEMIGRVTSLNVDLLKTSFYETMQVTARGRFGAFGRLTNVRLKARKLSFKDLVILKTQHGE